MKQAQENSRENYNRDYGQLIKQTYIAGYPVAVCISNKESEKHENGIVTQLVHSYEERKKALDSTLDTVRMNTIR